MSDSTTITSLVLAKLEEQIERVEHMLDLIPADRMEWRPLPDALRVCDLLGHLLECLAGFCAALYALDKQGLPHFARLSDQRVNHCCGIEEARLRVRDYRERIREGFRSLKDSDLTRRLPTIFVPEGEAALTLLLGNLEHFINHKYQLFFYLKLLGVAVSTRDLYQIK